MSTNPWSEDETCHGDSELPLYQSRNFSQNDTYPVQQYGSIPPPPPTNSSVIGTFSDDDDDDEGFERKKNPFSLYMHFLNTYPLVTKCITSGLLAMTSDLIAQIFEGVDFANLKLRRLLSMAFIGSVFSAPSFHVLYGYLETVLPTNARKINVLAHLVVDQLIAAPLWLVGFFPLLNVCEGVLDKDILIRSFERDYIPALKATWMVFPLIQALNFSVVPMNMRVLVLNIVDVFYTTILSFISHRPPTATNQANG